MSQNSRRPETIPEYLEKYRESYIGFAATAAYLQNACRSALSSSGILANVTSRAKDADRLNTKLLKMVEEKRFDPTKNVEDQIVDLIGVRVILYFPSQVDEVVARFQTLFLDTKLDIKETKDKPMTSKDLLVKLNSDSTMTTLDAEPTLPNDPKKEAYTTQYGDYRAVHIRFTLNEYGLGSELQALLKDRCLKVEIQIQTLLMHSWSEVNHDLSYKTLSGEVSIKEHQLLDCLNGVGKLGEQVLVQLKKTMDCRLDKGTENFKSAFELAEYIRQRVENLNKSVPRKPYVLGDVDGFLDFLIQANQNERVAVQKALTRLENVFDVQRPIVNTLIPSLNKVWLATFLSLETPFLLTEQNAKVKTGLPENRYEVLATIFDMACRSILQARPENLVLQVGPAKLETVLFPVYYMGLVGLGLYKRAKPVMPKMAFPVDRAVLSHKDLPTKMEKLAEFFNKYSMQNPWIQYSLRMAQISAWKMYGDKDFSASFNF